jgi:hypothetical protein
MTAQTKTCAPRTRKTAVAQAIAPEDYVPFLDAEVLKHPVIGAVANLAMSALGIYSGMLLAVYLGTAAMLLSGSALLGLLITFFVGFIGVLQALRAGAWISRYMATGQFEVDYARAKHTVRSWIQRLDRNEMEVQHV